MVAEAVPTEPDISAPLTDLPGLRSLQIDGDVHVRNLARRELDIRIMPWDARIESVFGTESFSRGAFADTDASHVLLQGVEHEARIGIGQDGSPKMIRVPVGKGISLEERDDAAYMTFRVAQTARGDEVLALAAEGIAAGASVEFSPTPNGSEVSTRAGRRDIVHKLVRLNGVSTTYQPAYAGAAVVAVRTKGDTDVSDAPAAEATQPEAPPTPSPAFDVTAMTEALKATVSEAINARSASDRSEIEAVLARLDQIEEQGRANFTLPAKAEKPELPPELGGVGGWAKFVLRSLTGDQISNQEIQARTAADLITTDNLGVVPSQILDEFIGIIDPARPFLESTRKVNVPASGMSMSVPTLVTKPTTGIQSTEKSELASTTTSITSTSFSAVTIGGYGDISLQLLKRSDPSYLQMYIELLAEQYAIDSDDKAVDVLLAEGTINVGATGVAPAAGLTFGDAWANAVSVSRLLRPDTIWLSTAAVQAFIDAKLVTEASGANQPLYSNLAANFNAANGTGGFISGLRPVYVPALDDENADILVGPSRGFLWAEDGTYTLQVDVPAKAGRDVGLVGMSWYMPMYPAAYTWYWLSSS